MLPFIAPKDVTEPKPFDLLTEERGTHYKSFFEQKVQEEQQLMQQQAQAFKAQPAAVL